VRIFLFLYVRVTPSLLEAANEPCLSSKSKERVGTASRTAPFFSKHPLFLRARSRNFNSSTVFPGRLEAPCFCSRRRARGPLLFGPVFTPIGFLTELFHFPDDRCLFHVRNWTFFFPFFCSGWSSSSRRRLEVSAACNESMGCWCHLTVGKFSELPFFPRRLNGWNFNRGWLSINP